MRRQVLQTWVSRIGHSRAWGVGRQSYLEAGGRQWIKTSARSSGSILDAVV